MAHGYLAQNFVSPLSNRRPDRYGGSAENRAGDLLETLEAVREVWPEYRPLQVRLSVVEFDADDERMSSEAVALLQQMMRGELDGVDVSIGFHTPATKIPGRRTSRATSPGGSGARRASPPRRAGTSPSPGTPTF